MNHLKAFFQDKEAQKEWADFIMAQLNEEALLRVYAGKDTGDLKEARNVISKSFKKLNELFTPKTNPRRRQRAV
ncbi:hypothetical protein UNPF46_08605 [Bradyrhizobium sp. UNPF46]|uniref:hypothetical protein n=1 Tax=Bradyrhizobium sp. UNPF46 TaxID=1141168 RepID=UPI00114DD262|nr:hypothetical protein [Bradyrhizobium sp. UNPF46]TQF41171.1 hypothetical protein UNPF46_08605 [Bradyrhizobium sp. UNPF46]